MEPQAARPALGEIETRSIAASPEATALGARTLAAGGLVAFPTETVYGLGADAGNGEAIARLYAAKERPAFNPLIAHVSDFATAQRLAHFNPAAEKLARQFWPGPLTLVLPRRADSNLSDLACAGLDSVALRVPAHDVARKLLAEFGRPVVAPSANRSGHVSPTSAAHVMADLAGRIDLIIDGGISHVGLESTIVSCLGAPTLLRPGGLAREAIESALGVTLAEPSSAMSDADAPLAPGMLESHYAPRARLRLDATHITKDEALLAFGAPLPEATIGLNLSACGDLIEAAANLFSHLRALDAANTGAIAVMPIPTEGLGEAINDRLRRAAAPRPINVSVSC
jgi:L-threonylcarbamoyladenylate synthase